MSRPTLVFTQGDPAGIGPEILLKVMTGAGCLDYLPLLVVEHAALLVLQTALPGAPWERLHLFGSPPTRSEVEALDGIAVFDPVADRRQVVPGRPGPADAYGALAALDAGVAFVADGTGDALVTAPLAKSVIAHHLRPSFRGHTEYLAEGAGLERYGRDYLMAFLAPELQVALLSTHVPLLEAIRLVERQRIEDALLCLARHAPGRVAVAGLNPHAGEGGLLGEEDDREVGPAVTAARERGIDAHGPASADSLFARAKQGEFDWVLALYHDQGLIAVKTAAFGTATNWTLGLPYLRTSVDHGTAFEIAGRGKANAGPMATVIETTLGLLEGTLPRRRF